MSDSIMSRKTLRECIKSALKEREDVAKLRFNVEDKRADAYIVTITGIAKYSSDEKAPFTLTFKAQYHSITNIKLVMPLLPLEKPVKKIGGADVEAFDEAADLELETFEEQIKRLQFLSDITLYLNETVTRIDALLEEDFSDSDGDAEEEDDDEDD